MKDGIARGVPIGRMISPEEIAQSVLYLASPVSSAQIGTEIIVDGGMLIFTLSF
ncbi:SDR family oxidoreductase [Olivibacter sitiensis]|uniref:SDR family oxidoreductase n=1 Tax=Olivibacter sitiensis TaxID=376470 RepID=UPI00248144EF|nr:SDR family oxidoreductase [Olivibacter sitiensis]